MQILSERDSDGFYQARHKLTDRVGLVPSNFVKAAAAIVTTGLVSSREGAEKAGAPARATSDEVAPKKKRGLFGSIKSKLLGGKSG